jgi:phage shock protein A
MSIAIRLWNLFRGLSSRTVSFFERRNPEALLELERESLRKLIGQFNQGLVGHAAISERLLSEVKQGTAKAADLTLRIRALVRAGNREAAARYALDLKDIEARLTEDREQLGASEATYLQLVRTRDEAVAEAKRKIELVRRDIGDLKVKRAIADLDGMAQAMIGSVLAPGDSINRLQDMVTEEREKVTARLRVSGHPLDPEALRVREREREALAADALDEFLQADGESSSVLPPLLTDQSQHAAPNLVSRSRRDTN